MKAISADNGLSIKRQCELFGVSRSSFYYKPKQPSDAENEREELIKSRIDYWHTKMCYLGVRRLAVKLREDGINAGRKLVKRYMDEMGIYAVCPKPNLSKRNMAHRVFPYLLKNLAITAPNQVWAVDITYVKMGRGHMYLTAIIDWYSRYIVGWELSDSLDSAPVLAAVKKAVSIYGKPEIINSDQGCQFTCEDYTKHLREQGIRQSMDGKARWVDNVIIERWFRSLKCDYLYITEHETPKSLRRGVAEYVREYNTERPHQSLEYKYPATVYAGEMAA